MIFFDLDGTLLAPGSRLTPGTLEVLRGVRERGTTLVLATGGFSPRALALARQIDSDGAWHNHGRIGRLADLALARQIASDGAPATWVIALNGAALWNPQGELSAYDLLPAAVTRTVLEHAGPRVWVAYEALDGKAAPASPGVGQAARQSVIYFAGRHRSELDGMALGPPELGVPMRVARGPARSGEGVLGCWCIGTDLALAPVDEAALDESFLGARYTRWSTRIAQILGRPRLRLEGRDIGPVGTTKATAAARLLAALGLDAAETAAFGDADNDLELLSLAGTSVAMANATPEVLTCADLVAPPNAEEGVARVLAAWLHLPHL